MFTFVEQERPSPYQKALPVLEILLRMDCQGFAGYEVRSRSHPAPLPILDFLPLLQKTNKKGIMYEIKTDKCISSYIMMLLFHSVLTHVQ